MVKNNSIHYSDEASILKFQEDRLKETLNYLAEKSPFYKEMFAKHNIDVSEIKHLSDLHNIPVTTKEDLQRRNKDFICVENHQIVDYVTTSGTLGEPVTFALSDSDLDRLAYNEASSFSLAGCKKGDVIQLMTTIDRRFMAGLAYFLGARELGCGIIRVGNGIPELQWDTINKLSPNVCIVVPSFLMKLIDYAIANGIDYNNSSLRKAICIGEALRTPNGEFTTLGRKISEKWPNLELLSTYASTEMQSSYTECYAHSGCHIPIDLIIVEILDDNNNPVPDGLPGEVTITTLGVEAMPLLRFKTGDICIRQSSSCSCGRHSPRLSSVIGRRGQMIKFKGTTLYPPALFDILDNIAEVENYIVEVFTNDLGVDQIQIKIGTKYQSDILIKNIKDSFRSKVRVAPDICFVPIELINSQQHPQMSRKPIKFFDLR